MGFGSFQAKLCPTCHVKSCKTRARHGYVFAEQKIWGT